MIYCRHVMGIIRDVIIIITSAASFPKKRKRTQMGAI
jgi:hypothetical protein